MTLLVALFVSLGFSCKRSGGGGDASDGAAGEEVSAETTGEATGTGTDDDASVEQGEASQELTGIYLVNFDEARARCDSRSVDDGYVIACEVVAQLPNGIEVAVGGIADQTKFQWDEPTTLAGTAVDFQCEAREDGLALTCAVPTKSIPVDPALLFKLDVAAASGATRQEQAVVTLPYSVAVTAGMAPYVPVRYQPGKTAASGSGKELGLTEGKKPAADDVNFQHGFQAQGIPAADFPMSDEITNVCAHGDDVFFSNKGAIMRLHDGVVTYVAGVPYSFMIGDYPLDLKGEDHSHARRYALGWDFSFACAADGTLVVQRGNFDMEFFPEVVRLGLTGAVTSLAGSPVMPTAQPVDGLEASKVRLPKSPWWLSAARGAAWIYDTEDSTFWRIDGDGKLRPAFSGALLDAVEESNALPALDDDDGIWVVAFDLKSEGGDLGGVLRHIAKDGKTRDYVLSDEAHPFTMTYNVKIDAGADGTAWATVLDPDTMGGILAVQARPDGGVSRLNIPLLSAPRETGTHVSYATSVDGKGHLIVAASHIEAGSPFAVDPRIFRIDGNGEVTPLIGSPQAQDPCAEISDARAQFLPASDGVFVSAHDQRDLVVIRNRFHSTGFKMTKDLAGIPVLKPLVDGTSACGSSPWLESLFSLKGWLDDRRILVTKFTKTGPGFFEGTIGLESIDIETGKAVPLVGGGARTPDETTKNEPATDFGFPLKDVGLAIPAVVVGESIFILVSSRIYEVDVSGRLSYVVDAAEKSEQFPGTVLAAADTTHFFEVADASIWAVETGKPAVRIAGGGGETEANALQPALKTALGEVWSLKAAPDGSLYLHDNDNNLVRRVFQKRIGGDWYIESVFGGRAGPDCGTGIARGEAEASEVGKRLAASAATMCAGVIHNFDIGGACRADGSGQYRVLIGQDIGGFANVVELRVPCRTPAGK